MRVRTVRTAWGSFSSALGFVEFTEDLGADGVMILVLDKGPYL